MTAWERGLVHLTLGDPRAGEVTGRETVEARLYGPFAVHKDDTGFWSITHRPTGRYVAGYETLKRAQAVCRRLLPIRDWESVDGETPPEPEISRRMHAAISSEPSVIRFL